MQHISPQILANLEHARKLHLAVVAVIAVVLVTSAAASAVVAVCVATAAVAVVVVVVTVVAVVAVVAVIVAAAVSLARLHQRLDATCNLVGNLRDGDETGKIVWQRQRNIQAIDLLDTSQH